MPFAGVDATTVLHQAMRVAELNQRIISNNIANADTPHYNGARLDFQATLQNAIEGRDRVSLRKTQVRHLDATRLMSRLESIAATSKNDYNKVDLDQEMLDLSENTGKYVTYASLMTKRFQIVKNMFSNIR